MLKSTTFWIIITVIILGGGGWYLYTNSPSDTTPVPTPPVAQTPPPAPPTPPPAPPTPQEPANDAGMSEKGNSSNAALEQDMNSVDIQINNLNADAASANATETPQ